MMKSIYAGLCLLITLSLAVANEEVSEVPQRGYSTETLRDPVFDIYQVATGTFALDLWLKENYEELALDQMRGPRGRLYSLIDSYVKFTYERDNRILPEQRPERIIETLFSWAELLGAYGGNLVYNVVKSSDSPEMAPLMRLPTQIALSLQGDLFTISAKAEGWSVNIPYYFMIRLVEDFVAENGQRTQFVALSTGTARDSSETGYSQAVLFLVYSPDVELTDFAESWKQEFGVSDEAEKKSLGVRDLTSLYDYDPGEGVHQELTMWKGVQGCFAVAYKGLDGAYQWNRPHFLDFLRSLEVREPSPLNTAPQPMQ